MDFALTPTDRREAPRCCECQGVLVLAHALLPGITVATRCGACGVQLIVRHVCGRTWHVRTAAEAAGQRMAPLPVVTHPGAIAAGRISQRLLTDGLGVEPGTAALAREGA